MKCKNCDIEIERKDPRAVFCCKSCSASYNNKIFPKRKKKYLVCAFCGILRSNQGKIYCSQRCSADAIKLKHKLQIAVTGVAPNQKAARNYLIAISNACSICGTTTWMDKEIPLVLDHINGNPYDNKLVNLRLICCNCDAQTETYKGKNTGNGRHYRRTRYAEGKSY